MRIGCCVARASLKGRRMSAGRSVVDFSNPLLLSQLDSIKARYGAVTDIMSNSSDPGELRKLGKEYSDLGRTMELIVHRDECVSSLSDLQEMLEDEEMADMAQEETEEVKAALEKAEEGLVNLLTPKDSADDRGVVVEVRSGTGGDEASLFASELFKMYHKYALGMGWRWEELDMSITDIGGFKGAQASVSGEAVFERLKFESGVHRVQVATPSPPQPPPPQPPSPSPSPSPLT